MAVAKEIFGQNLRLKAKQPSCFSLLLYTHGKKTIGCLEKKHFSAQRHNWFDDHIIYRALFNAGGVYSFEFFESWPSLAYLDAFSERYWGEWQTIIFVSRFSHSKSYIEFYNRSQLTIFVFLEVTYHFIRRILSTIVYPCTLLYYKKTSEPSKFQNSFFNFYDIFYE